MLHRFNRCTSGTALIEAAVVVPFAIVLMVGVADFGRVYMTKATAQKSMRDAVRYLTLLPADSVCRSWALTNAQNLAVKGNIAGSGAALLDGWVVGDVSLSLPTTCATPPLGVIRVSANVPFTAIMWQVLGLPSSMTLSVQHEERWIGQ